MGRSCEQPKERYRHHNPMLADLFPSRNARAKWPEDHAGVNTLQTDASQGLFNTREMDTDRDRSGVGIMIADPTFRRLVETLVDHLHLAPTMLLPAHIDELRGGESQVANGLELIIADEAEAQTIRGLLLRGEEHAEGLNPALVAVRTDRLAPLSSSAKETDQEFEGVLVLPQDPAVVLAQLSVILYAHRAYVRRYQTTLDELHLNRRIFRSVTSGITVADATQPDMPLVYVNPAFEVMTGYSFEEVDGKNCRFLQGNEHSQPALTLIREAMKAEREVVTVLKNFRKNGTPFWNELSISPIRSREGIVTHFVGIQMDVTARVEFEEALRESEKLAAVGRLAASIAHEINNPLESVMNLLYLAQHAEGVDDIKNFLGQADKELQRVALITSQSLRFYKQSTNPQAVRPMEMLEAVLEFYHSKLQSGRITIKRRKRTSDSIVCMESEIRQVLNNLVRNAIDATQGTGGTLYVRSRETTEWRRGFKGVLITVADTGTGISPETMRHLYTPFYTTKGISGTGLGLWVSAEIVERHQGRLRVRSSQRPGNSWTVFQLFLPYQGLTS